MDSPKKLKRPPTKGTRHGNGAGWGGPAKGASTAPASIQTAPPFTSQGDTTPGARAALREERRLRAMQVIDDVMMRGTYEQNRLKAAESMLNRIDGTPIARSVSLEKPLDGMSDAELVALIDHIRSQLGGVIEPAGTGAGEAEGGESVGRVSAIH